MRDVGDKPSFPFKHLLERFGHLVERRRKNADLVGARLVHPCFEQPFGDAQRRCGHFVQWPQDPGADALREDGADQDDGEPRNDERAQQHAHRLIDVRERVEEIKIGVRRRQRRAERELARATHPSELVTHAFASNEPAQLRRDRRRVEREGGR